MRGLRICDSNDYASLKINLESNTGLKDKWIYDLIEGRFEQETVLHDDDEWLLCKDKHIGADDRYLVVFKDLNLKTLRELTHTHIPVLLRIRQTVRRILEKVHGRRHSTEYAFYFHYLPSVFQLHLHVRHIQTRTEGGEESVARGLNFDRIHMLSHVLRNLQTDSAWYSQALIMTPSNRAARLCMNSETVMLDCTKNQSNMTCLMLARATTPRKDDNRQWLGQNPERWHPRRLPVKSPVHPGMRFHRRSDKPNEIRACDNMEAVCPASIRQASAKRVQYGRSHRGTSL